MKISVLGSTGSIGTQTLEVVEHLGDVEVLALTAHSNIDLLEQQITRFKPRLAVVYEQTGALELKKRVDSGVEVLSGLDGLVAAAALASADMVVNALVGNVGLLPTVAAINARKNVALANKEVLACAGELIMPMAKATGVQILPIDSEHSAIFQCLAGNEGNEIERIYLTASGGPFRGYTPERLAHVTVADALNHPNWDMGRKITIDSATMMNKGLEVMEARWLFDVDPRCISVLVHPQSIIHSMVEFTDGQILAQLGAADMRLPIQHVLTHPRRMTSSFARLDFARHNTLTFEQPDYETFPCLRLAYDALAAGGLIPAILNAANETAVEMFLAEKIPFNQISVIIDRTISAYTGSGAVDINNIMQADSFARRTARDYAATM
ncbi:MAG: 1-deoxy-D-xylulose-5-phosphate reductoisomerase [Defluviitaleaceae bacterium]|nr:1-deoxy-D-xylulose-5-phosphate reductoisomerase [Defluviitaleaceae bacterium]